MEIGELNNKLKEDGMKKLGFLLFLVMAFAVVAVSPNISVAAESQTAKISVLLDGSKLDFEVAPQIQNDRIMVPFRKIAENLNIQVNWDGSLQQITASDGKTNVVMVVNKQYAMVNGQQTKLEAEPQIVGGSTLIPARFFSETFGCKVSWIPDSRLVKISSPAKVMQVTAFYALGDQKSSSWTDLFTTPYPNTSVGNTGMVNRLALGWYSLAETGELLTASSTGWQRPDSWEKVVDAAEQYNLKIEMVVHITDGDGKLTRCLGNSEAVKTAVEAIAAEAVLYNGVNLDFEGLGWNEDKAQLAQTQANFTNFATLLSQELKKSSRQLTLTLHAPNSAYLGYDYAALGKVADYIIIMAYDYGSKPEPVAMIRQAVETAEFSVPTSKLLLGISVVGENPESLQTITGVAKKYNLGGIALWRLGLLNSETWRVLGENVIKSSL